MDESFVPPLNLLVILVASTPLNSSQVILGFLFVHQGIYKVSFLYLGQIVTKDRLKNEALSMLKFTRTMHHTMPPAAYVNMAVVLI